MNIGNSQKGFAIIPIIIVLAVLVIGGGTYVVLQNKNGSQNISIIDNNKDSEINALNYQSVFGGIKKTFLPEKIVSIEASKKTFVVNYESRQAPFTIPTEFSVVSETTIKKENSLLNFDNLAVDDVVWIRAYEKGKDKFVAKNVIITNNWRSSQVIIKKVETNQITAEVFLPPQRRGDQTTLTIIPETEIRKGKAEEGENRKVVGLNNLTVGDIASIVEVGFGIHPANDKGSFYTTEIDVVSPYYCQQYFKPTGCIEKKQVPSQTENEIPNIIGNITTNPETGDQKPEINFQISAQVRKDVQNGKLSWFKDPVEVSKKYGNRFGIASNSQYSLEQAATAGEDSGLMHSTVLAINATKSYRIYLISEQSQPYVWMINAVSDVQQSNKLRVTSFSSASTYDTDGVGHQEIVTKFGDGSTLFYLNVKKPIVTFLLNQPAKSSTVSSDSIIVKVNNTVLGGATAKAVTEQGSSHGATFLMYSIQVDLSGISNLKNYIGQNVQIILTDKIKDNSGNPLQQCDRAYNAGECIADTYGQKVKVFGAELKLYSL